MLIILLGPPGAGKGTQAELLAAKYQLLHIATGDILRSAVNKGSPLGKKAREFMDKGQLVPGEIVVQAVFEKLEELSDIPGFFSMASRTLEQANYLERALKQRGPVSIGPFISSAGGGAGSPAYREKGVSGMCLLLPLKI